MIWGEVYILVKRQKDDIEFSFYKEVQEASRVYNNEEIIQPVELKSY